jgi:hypothetical protein
VVAGCAAVQLVLVAVIAARQPTDGGLAVAAALVLAPVGIAAAALTADRLASGWFPACAAVVYVLLPFLANRFVLGPHRAAFDRHALPALVGVQETGLLAVGAAAAVLAATAPELAAAAAGAVVLVAALVARSPGALGDVKPMLHETAWSTALPEWLAVATIAAVVLRRPLLGAGIGCFAAAVTLYASHRLGGEASFWRALAPLVPLGAVLVSSLWLLVPPLPWRLRRDARPASS